MTIWLLIFSMNESMLSINGFQPHVEMCPFDWWGKQTSNWALNEVYSTRKHFLLNKSKLFPTIIMITWPPWEDEKVHTQKLIRIHSDLRNNQLEQQSFLTIYLFFHFSNGIFNMMDSPEFQLLVDSESLLFYQFDWILISWAHEPHYWYSINFEFQLLIVLIN